MKWSKRLSRYTLPGMGLKWDASYFGLLFLAMVLVVLYTFLHDYQAALRASLRDTDFAAGRGHADSEYAPAAQIHRLLGLYDLLRAARVRQLQVVFHGDKEHLSHEAAEGQK